MIRYKTRQLNRRDAWITKWHFTKGKFSNWTEGGAFGFTYAAIVLRSKIMFIPIHDLHPDDRARLKLEHPLPEKENTVQLKESQSE